MGAREWDALLYIVSAVAELVGVGLTIHDLFRAVSRRQEFLSKGVEIKLTGRITGKGETSADITGGVPASTEDRLRVIEEWQQHMPKELDRRENALRSEITSAINAAYDTFLSNWRNLRKYLQEDKRLVTWPYWGPVFIALGIVVGMLANLINIYCVSSH